MKRIVSFMIITILLLQCLCTDVSSNVYAAKKIKLNKSSVTMSVGESLQLKVKGTSKKAKWKSSKKKVANVTKKGKVTAKKTGKATITAIVGKKKLKCKVTVIKKTEVTTEAPNTYLDNEGYKDDVIVDQVSDQTDYTVNADNAISTDSDSYDITITKNDKTSSLKKGDVVVLPSNESNESQLVTKITEIKDNGDGYSISGVSPELNEVFDEVKINDTCKADMSTFSYNSEFFEEVGNDLAYGAVKTQVSTTIGENKSYELKEMTVGKYGKVSGNVTIFAPEVNADIDISFDDGITSGRINKFELSTKEKIVGQANVTFSRENASLDKDINIYLGHVDAPLGYGFIADVVFYLTIRADGKATIVCTLTDTYKLSYNKNSGFDKDNDLDISFEGTEAEVNAELLYHPVIGVRYGGIWSEKKQDAILEVDIIESGFYVGPGLKATLKVHDTAPYTCANIEIYGVLRAEIVESVGIAKIVKSLFPKLNMSWELWGNSDDNPFRKVWHYEDGKKIETGKCSHDKTISDDISSTQNAYLSDDEIQNGEYIEKTLEELKKNNYSQALEYSKMIKNNVPDTSVNNMSPEVRAAYLKVVMEYVEEKGIDLDYEAEVVTPVVLGYYLCDMDNDNVPELMIEYGTCESDIRVDVFAYEHSRTIKKGNFTTGHSLIYAYPNHNGIIVGLGHMGYEQFDLVTITSTSVKQEKIYGKSMDQDEEYVYLGSSLDSHIVYNDYDYKEIDLSVLEEYTTYPSVYEDVVDNVMLETKGSKLVLDDTGETCQYGNDIYYAFENYHDFMGIYKYNLYDSSNVELVSNIIDGCYTCGFDSISVTNDYIVACWETSEPETIDSKRYIYRFDKNGNNPVRLALGYSPVMVEDYIYYLQLKRCWHGLWDTTDAGYICRMKLDGSNKSIVTEIPLNSNTCLYRCGNSIVYSDYSDYSDEGDYSTRYYDVQGNDYSIKDIVTKNSLEFNTYTGESIEHFSGYTVSDDENNKYTLYDNYGKRIDAFNYICSIRFCENNIFVNSYDNNERTVSSLYCLSLDGKTPKKRIFSHKIVYY